MERPQAILFDVDGLLITTGGAGADYVLGSLLEELPGVAEPVP
jgi:hypothetical protein